MRHATLALARDLNFLSLLVALVARLLGIWITRYMQMYLLLLIEITGDYR